MGLIYKPQEAKKQGVSQSTSHTRTKSLCGDQPDSVHSSFRLSQMTFSLDDSESNEAVFADQDSLDWSSLLDEGNVVTANTKKCHFAQDIEVVHEVEKVDDLTLWWSSEDDEKMLANAKQEAETYAEENPKFAEAIKILSRTGGRPTPKAFFEKSIKVVADDFFGRGLEKLIVPRTNTVIQSVLQEQNECRGKHLDYSNACERLRLHSLQHATTTLALRLAESDRLSVEGKQRRRASLSDSSRRLQRVNSLIRLGA